MKKRMMPTTALAVLLAGTAYAQEQEQNKTKAHALDEVVVTATRTPHTLKDVPVETVVVSRQEIEQSNAQNALDVLKTVPGINNSVHDDVFGTYTWRANMHGLNFNDGYGLILIDGQRAMGCGQSGGMGEYGIGLNQLPVDMIERIEVVKGPSSALYGSDAMAGVINIITRRTPQQMTARAGASYGWYTIKEKVNSDGTTSPASDDGDYRNTSQAYFSFGDKPSERLGYLLNYNYESAQDARDTPIDSDRHSLMAKIDLAASDSVDLFLKGEASSYEKEDNREEDSLRLSPGMEWRLGEDKILFVKGYVYNWDFTHGSPGYAHGYKYGDIGYTQGEVQYTWYTNDSNTLTFGGELQRQAIDYTIENPTGSVIRVDEEVDTASLYAQDEIVLGEALTVVGGLRFDDHSVFDSEINPKLSLMYTLSEGITLRASAGRSFKSPTIRQLYYNIPYQHGDYYVQSNRDLQPELGVGYSAGIEQWLADDQLMLSASLFRNEVEDMVIQEETGALYDALPLRSYYNVDEATTQGLELSARLNLDDFSFNCSYTYTDSENNESGLNLPYVPEHSLALIPSYTYSPYGLIFSGVLSYTGKQYTDSGNTSEIGEHTVVDARIAKQLGKRTTLSFEADNIFDSDKGDDGNYRTGRAFLAKLDYSF
ncbi:MAG: TonB-dependent receptor [Candidatus Electrothrix sp. GW3-4]|uniref:TonB-dependent receptor plug domain-containing protein n=1 Tax=Candidatus Electrothrix sp. GW3-4 TaxID=3126740 RepID=UPI0030D25EC6